MSGLRMPSSSLTGSIAAMLTSIATFLLALIPINASASTYSSDELQADYWAGFRATADYFIDERDGFSGRYELDDSGVLLSVYRDKGTQFNPMFAASYAVSACREYKSTSQRRLLDAMATQLERIASDGKRKKSPLDFMVWEYDFDLPVYRLKAPWVSGLAQARIAAAFVCAYDVTAEERYRRLATEAMNAFKVETRLGGVATQTESGVYFEEIAKPGFRSTKVLNGHLSALQVVWLWAEVSKDRDFKELFDRGARAVHGDLEHYDAKFISWYDQDPEAHDRHIAPRGDYNNLHVTQLAWLYHASGDAKFLKYSLRFSGYEHPRLSFSSNHSTNPTTHGPENIGFFGYSSYWSSSRFPVILDVDLGGQRVVPGAHVWGYTEAATPRDFDIFSSTDGREYELVAEIRGHRLQRAYLQFGETVQARHFKIAIFSDNGNDNVAISGIAFVGGYTKARAISSRIRMTSVANRFFGEGFEMRAHEWLLVDYAQERADEHLWLIKGLNELDSLAFEWSTNLTDFHSTDYRIVENRPDGLLVGVKTQWAPYVRFTSPRHGVVAVAASARQR